jgi:hypothetical protein
MDFELIKGWLTRWTNREANSYRLKGFLGFALAPVALVVALTLIYLLLLLLAHRSRDPGIAVKCLWITLAILPCLFIGNRLAPRRNLMEERMSAGSDDVLGNFVARREVLPLLFLWIVFTGPRLFDWAAASFRESKRLKQMDIHSCAAVIWMLVSAGRKVSFEDIQRDLEWVNMEAVFPELKQISGVLILYAPPPGLTLTPELRNSILDDLRTNAS